MLVIAGAAIGNTRELELKPTWHEAARIYLGVVGDPASGKTPAIDLVLKPEQARQQSWLEASKRDRNAYLQALSHRNHIVQMNKGGKPTQLPVPPVPDEPALPIRIIVGDTTVEALVPIHENNPGGLLMVIDEGSGWAASMGQYKNGKGNDRQFFLSAWSGKSLTVDRKSQGGIPLSIHKPFLSVLLGIQPDMLGELADQRGRSDGFLHRILFVYPKRIGAGDWSDATVSEFSASAWERTLERLRQLALPLFDGVPHPQVVHFTPAAKMRWVEWWDFHAAEMRDPQLPAYLLGPWGKLISYAARLTLILHYLWLTDPFSDEQTERGVEATTVDRALRLIDYFKDHLRRIYARLREAPDDGRIESILDFVRRRGGECTARVLVRSKKVHNTEAAKKVMLELEERGYGRCEARTGKNGRKQTVFVFDPGSGPDKAASP